MKINLSTVKKALNTAYEILDSVVPDFKKPCFAEIKFGRSRTSWASVSKRKGSSKFILRVSNVFECIPDEAEALRRLEECMIHEVIHTLPNCFNHGYYFKKWASKVNFYYSRYTIQRCTSMDDYGIERRKLEYKYKVTCLTCGKEFFYKKKRWWFDCSNTCTCPACRGSKFKIESI